MPPIKGGDGEESKFPRAASASKYIQATHDDGNKCQRQLFFLINIKFYLTDKYIFRHRYKCLYPGFRSDST